MTTANDLPALTELTLAAENSRSQPVRSLHPKLTASDWDKTVRLHNHRVVVSLLALGLRIDQAEEVASQTWQRLMEKHANGELEDIRIPGLAIHQARFLGLNALKQQQQRQRTTVPLDGPGQNMIHTAANPETQLIAREQLDRALSVLNQCSGSAQAVFLHAYDDPPPTHAQIAERLGLSVQRVRQILCEVRKKMRHAMEDRP